ncbi:hypothetical protein [Myxococcus qinghaiensis]|uniref:hypothetical protein n=1 Tax=Myxococcus qinghaiensis TaxID=2906758 RepID=UPI0020A7A435|nr:hypothetical protein [Myxococcus qinghaiensis]MCP3162212.1 hypothetical protein [Myxococcus qinghaiensis]
MATPFEDLSSFLTPFVPRNYCDLLPQEDLQPADLVTLGMGLAWMLEQKRDDLAGWYRPLSLAVFERFGLMELPQHQAMRDQASGVELLKVLGVVGSPGLVDGLGRAWLMRGRLLALPQWASGVLAGHPFQLSVLHRKMPTELRPMAEEVADALAVHASSANKLARKLDRSIVALWGCPLEKLDPSVTVAELIVEGLQFQSFED